MPTLCFDPVGGAAGDMILAALMDLGASPEEVDRQVRSSGLEEYELVFERRQDDSGIAAGFCSVHVHEHGHRHGHEHGDAHAHAHGRHLPEIQALIDAGDLVPRARQRAHRIFQRLADAEAAVHGIAPEQVHFHEVGAVDSIVDIVGCCIALELLDVDTIRTGPMKTGRGTVECAHGILPVPTPATVKLLEGHNLVRLPVDAELTTPTGAAILTTLSQGNWEGLPFRMIRCGTGHGRRSHRQVPNVIRAYLCETEPDTEILDVLQADVDDDTPERLAHVADRLRDLGARDVVLLGTAMKKGRHGIRIEALVDRRQTPDLVRALLAESSTIGVRTFPVQRFALERETVTIQTPWGTVDGKKVHRPDGPEIVPEYESCRQLANSANVSLRRVMQAAAHAGGD